MPVDLSDFASVLLQQPIKLKEGTKAISQPEDGTVLVVKKWLNSPYKAKHCWHNCRQHVGSNGGRIVFGWALFYEPDKYQAQHHAVWCDANGDYLDITPDVLPTVQKTVFLPDGRVPYDFERLRHPASFFFIPSEKLKFWHVTGTELVHPICFFITGKE
jgi:hypothetical protein